VCGLKNFYEGLCPRTLISRGREGEGRRGKRGEIKGKEGKGKGRGETRREGDKTGDLAPSIE
jgi:hypothetical protein